jgi:hypothetical protein
VPHPRQPDLGIFGSCSMCRCRWNQLFAQLELLACCTVSASVSNVTLTVVWRTCGVGEWHTPLFP